MRWCACTSIVETENGGTAQWGKKFLLPCLWLFNGLNVVKWRARTFPFFFLFSFCGYLLGYTLKHDEDFLNALVDWLMDHKLKRWRPHEYGVEENHVSEKQTGAPMWSLSATYCNRSHLSLDWSGLNGLFLILGLSWFLSYRIFMPKDGTESVWLGPLFMPTRPIY